MKCPKCHSSELAVLSTRDQESGIIMRRRECKECAHRFTTHELPPGAYTQAKFDIEKWAARQVGEWKTKVRQREKLARQMCELKLQGKTAAELATRFGLSVHMAHYYTSPKAMQKLGITGAKA